MSEAKLELDGTGSGSVPCRRRSAMERRLIVEETLEAGSSVARVARAHGVNANQVFQWRRMYREGLLGGRGSSARSRTSRLHLRRRTASPFSAYSR